MTSPVLGFDLKTVREASALDIFAMPVPLSAKGEKLWDDAMVQIEQDRKNPAFNRGRKFTL